MSLYTDALALRRIQSASIFVHAMYNFRVMHRHVATLLFWTVLIFRAFGQGSPTSSAKDSKGTGESHAYEIVSIKPSDPGSTSGGTRVLPDGFEWRGATLSLLVHASYDLIVDNQVSGLPEWASREKYDIVAKADADTAEGWKKLTFKERFEREEPMMRSILADRCQFKAHQETRDMPVYDLVIAKHGLRMKEAPSDEDSTESESGSRMTAHAMTINAI